MTAKPPSHLIGKVLSPAVRLWLRSQVEAVETLEFAIAGGNRQILSGYIPEISLAARRAVYQGLHLTQVQLRGENIRANLGQAIKGKPLRLLEPIQVAGEVLLDRDDLQASLSAPLLDAGIKDVLSMLMDEAGAKNAAQVVRDWSIAWQNISIARAPSEQCEPRLVLTGSVANRAAETVPISLCTNLEVVGGHFLHLYDLEIEAESLLTTARLESFKIDLGADVELEELLLQPEQIAVRGALKVIPE